MRLINADALEREGWSLCRTFQKDKGTMVYEMKKPSDFPTIEERKKGEWMIDNDLYRCSACNHLWSELWWAEIVPFEKMLKLMPYCPNCGAEMKGEN